MTDERITEAAKELGAMIKENERYTAYMQAKEKYDNDEHLQALIGQYNLCRMAYDNDENKSEDNLNNLKNAYDACMANETMIDFMEKKETFETFANDIFGLINFEITGVKPCDHHDCEHCGGCH